MYTALNEALTAASKKPRSGGELLQALSAQCDQQDGTLVEGSNGLVFEFTVTLPELPTMPVTVWRALSAKGVPYLRRAPEADDAQAYKTQLEKMLSSARHRTNQRR